MIIKLDVMRDTPLQIADAIIDREFGFNAITKTHVGVIEQERIRQMGEALINFVLANNSILDEEE